MSPSPFLRFQLAWLALAMSFTSSLAVAAPRRMREEDLLSLVWVADPRISPDGARVAFTRVAVDTAEDRYETSIWMVETAGGEPRRITAGPRDGQPRWSPDGKILAFLRAEKDKPSQIWLLSMGGGEATALTSLKGGAGPAVWSPDGRQILFASETNPALDDHEKAKPKHEPGRVVTKPVFRINGGGYLDFEHPGHLWMVGASGGKARQLTTGKYDEDNPRWSRDGKWVYFVGDHRDQPWFGYNDQDLYAVPADLSKAADPSAFRTVWDIHGPVENFVEAPDGRIACIGHIEPEAPRSYDEEDLLISQGHWPRREAKNLTADYDFDIGGGIIADQHAPRGGGGQSLAFSADGRSLFVVAAKHGAAMLVRADAGTGAVTELTDSTKEVISGTSTPDGRTWALILGDVSRPGDLYLFDAQTRAIRKLWGPNDKLLAGFKLAPVEMFWYRSFDGAPIQAWIVKPPDFSASRKYPMILEIHGGPHVPYGYSFFHEFQLLAAAGYVVLYVNPRGSTSYGQEFGNAIQYHYPGDDYRDLMAGVDKLLERGYANPKKMGVTGGSGGGLLTNWIVTQTDRFAAAVTQRCVSEWISFYYSADFTLFRPTWFRKPPFEDPEEYIKRSPVTYASRIHTPLMIIHNEEDWRAPIGQGEAMFRALQQQKKTAVMVRFPGENHDLSRSGTPSRRIQRLRHIRQWFDQWLQGRKCKEYEQ